MDIDYNDHTLYPFIEFLEANAAVFAAEAQDLVAADFVPMPESGINYTAGSWSACPLFLEQYGDDFPESIFEGNRKRCPNTAELLKRIDNLVVGGFMVLRAGGKIRMHRDHRKDNVIRVHLALQLPEHEKAYWEEGRARLIDIRSPHQAHNDSETDRLTLCCDVRMGFDIPNDAIAPWGPPTP